MFYLSHKDLLAKNRALSRKPRKVCLRDIRKGVQGGGIYPNGKIAPPPKNTHILAYLSILELSTVCNRELSTAGREKHIFRLMTDKCKQGQHQNF